MKRFLATAMSILMLISVLSIGTLAVTPNDAVINIDFTNGIPDGMDVVGATLVDDAEKGQVLSFPGGETGTSKATIPLDAFQTTDFTSGLSWTVWAKAAPSDELHGMAPIFTIDFTRIGYLSLLSDLVVTSNTDGNEDWGIERVWSDPPAPVEDEVSVLKNEWAQYTVVIDSTATYLYVNGKLYERDPFDKGSLMDIPGVLLEQMSSATGITLGSYNCDWWKLGDFKGLMSSAAVYNKALTADEVKELFVSSGGTYIEEPTTEAPTTTEAPEEDATESEVETEADATTENEITTDDATEAVNADTEPTTTASAATDTDDGNNTTMIILIVVSVVVVVAIVGIIVFTSGKKSK